MDSAQLKSNIGNIIDAPHSWENPNNHIKTLLSDPWYRVTSKLLGCILQASHDFFKQEGIQPFLFPITTGSVSSPMGKGSDSLPVQIELRGNKVYLADSMQFSLEVGTRLAEQGCYYIMPTFRGEPMDERHLNEFFHSEAEIPGGLNDVMSLIQKYIYALAKYIRAEMSDEILSVAGTTSHIDALINSPQKHFNRIRYDRAVVELKDIPGALEMTETGFNNITKVGEKHLMNTHGQFLWLTNMPWASVPFYQAKEEGTNYAMNADLLAGIGEIVGCGQRVLSSEDLDYSLQEHAVYVSGYEWYREMREIRPMQTAGFGLGIERFMLWATNTQDIRDCMILLRDHDQVNMP